jgi:hypothetical protein
MLPGESSRRRQGAIPRGASCVVSATEPSADIWMTDLASPTFSQKESPVSEPQLCVRSAKARDLAHRLARRERRSIAVIVECALEDYQNQAAGREPAASFYARVSESRGADIDRGTVIAEGRRDHSRADL